MSKNPNKNEQQPNFLGDLEKTIIINQLMEVPFTDRNEQWRDDFFGPYCGRQFKAWRSGGYHE